MNKKTKKLHIVNTFEPIQFSRISILYHFQEIIDYLPKFKEDTWPWPDQLEGLFVCQSEG